MAEQAPHHPRSLLMGDGGMWLGKWSWKVMSRMDIVKSVSTLTSSLSPTLGHVRKTRSSFQVRPLIATCTFNQHFDTLTLFVTNRKIVVLPHSSIVGRAERTSLALRVALRCEGQTTREKISSGRDARREAPAADRDRFFSPQRRFLQQVRWVLNFIVRSLLSVSRYMVGFTVLP